MNNTPDPKIHLYLSLFKSMLRLVAGCALISQFFTVSGIFFIAAEVLGILEELF